jgi:hypothetical protein
MAMAQRGSERHARIVMSAVVLLAFFLRVVYLDQKSLWWDESTILNHIRFGFAFIFTNQVKWGDNI